MTPYLSFLANFSPQFSHVARYTPSLEVKNYLKKSCVICPN